MESAIYHDDCFNKFKDIPDKSVQLVCVDLPYNQTCCDFDKEIIDLEKMWIELKRILKPNGQAVLFCTTKFGYNLIKSNEKWFRYDIVWEKTMSVGFLSANRRPLRSHELIYLFHNPTKPKALNWIYNPQKTAGKPFHRERKPEKINIYGSLVRTRTDNPTGDRHPTSVLKIQNSNSKSKHPTQKPVDLCEWLIKTYSNEEDVVMDFTMGSGSTIIACINTNRKYVGIEKDENIFLTAQKRINERLETI
jgi:site-specific DNA-methyltransferase (adenine-specific)